MRFLPYFAAKQTDVWSKIIPSKIFLEPVKPKSASQEKQKQKKCQRIFGEGYLRGKEVERQTESRVENKNENRINS